MPCKHSQEKENNYLRLNKKNFEMLANFWIFLEETMG